MTNTFLKQFEVWFITGAQLLYGGDAVVKVDAHSNEMVKGLNESGNLPVKVVYKGTANSSSEIAEIMRAANGDTKCIGLITWMHTFSPAKMWIHGLMDYKKPLMHLHTQFNGQIPWSEIDMDYMNLNQSAHGDREFGFITSRLRKPRKVVVGFWKDKSTHKKISGWMRVCAGWAVWRSIQKHKRLQQGAHSEDYLFGKGEPWHINCLVRCSFSLCSFLYVFLVIKTIELTPLF